MASQQHSPPSRAGGAHGSTAGERSPLRRVTDGPAAEWISTAARLGLAVVWAWAGLAKVSDPAVAAQAVRAYRLLPEGLVKPVGYGLPFLEIALAVLLVIGLGVRIAAVISAVLLLTFIAGISSAWARGISIDCGCFGGGGAVDASQTEYLQEILRDIGFLLLALWLVFRPRTKVSVDAWLAA
ncbi:MauE/DoxX family redox-associated membrane protein [Kitasatospora mediocidica]|uniref:MauE/DoxX family redox-associated membrane protein n=1 Tax=Kitasatospora mediocidica TaxID=58352 RepID=UPI000A042089|nr:MauE/DoxX family redox-associated membrane protein [Kitasatospora mediocidica]